MPPKPPFHTEYECECGQVLKSVGDAAIANHKTGKRHENAMLVAADFQNYTCKCGAILKHVKQYQIDQHLKSKPCKAKHAALKQQSNIRDLVAPGLDPETAFYSLDDAQQEEIDSQGVKVPSAYENNCAFLAEAAIDDEAPRGDAPMGMEEQEEIPEDALQCGGICPEGLHEDKIIKNTKKYSSKKTKTTKNR